MKKPAFRIATRKSPLAIWQAEWVAGRLANVGYQTELVPLVSQGDVDMRPIQGGEGTGLFTRAIQTALLEQRADIAVHSLKDLPTSAAEGLTIAAISPREDVRDCLVADRPLTLEELDQEARVGSGSRRRQAQLRALRPDLVLEPIRGNVQTRLMKVSSGEFAATVLARAGLVRLGFDSLAANPLSLDQMLPAPGQGALGIEVRSDDREARAAVGKLNCPTTAAETIAERACLRTLEGGCLAPIAALARLKDNALNVRARVLAIDGSVVLEAQVDTEAARAEAAGAQLAEILLEQGAGDLLTAARTG